MFVNGSSMGVEEHQTGEPEKRRQEHATARMDLDVAALHNSNHLLLWDFADTL